jgi:hypothetical protein
VSLRVLFLVVIKKRKGTFQDIEEFTIPDVDGGLAATGWLLHHEYDGAVPTGIGFKGLRFRIGNVQIGGNALLEEFFTEPRFNSWSIGEVHIFDRRIVPNARRDDFEQNAHYSNLLNQLSPIARAISKRCRTSSKRRQLLRDFDVQVQIIKERLQILAQGGIRRGARKAQAVRLDDALNKMIRLANSQELEGQKDKLLARVGKLQEQVRTASLAAPSSPLDLLPPHKRAMYGRMIELIYDCSRNRVAAKALVDRILQKIIIADDEAPQRSKKMRFTKRKKLTGPSPSRTRRHKRRSRTTRVRSRPKTK